MDTKVSRSTRAATPRKVTKAASKPSLRTQGARARFPRDEMSTGRASAHRSAAHKTIAPPPSGADWGRAFEKKLADVRRAVANGVPGAREELAAVLHDRGGIQKAVADVEAKLAAARTPEARAKLEKQLAELKAFGLKVAGMNPTERDNLQRFFRLAKEDPAAFKRFVDAVKAGHVPQSAPVARAAPGAPANIQTAIEFGLSQLGAPYVGGASPFRFGTPGDGRTYQMSGQKAYVSPKGVIGYDCSGLMVTMLKKAGIDISRLGSSRAMKASLPQVPKDQLRPGDLLVKNGHVAMYIGDGKMIEAVPGGVKVSDARKYINDPAYSGHRPG